MVDHQFDNLESTELGKLLKVAVANKASDIHLNVGVKPLLRVDGQLKEVAESIIITEENCQKMVKVILTPIRQELLEKERSIDFSFSDHEMRFRANVYYEKNSLAASFRLIPRQINNMAELGLPPIIEKFTNLSQGFVIIAGPTGHGKSSTLAAILEDINTKRCEHIITIEDPIEFIFTPKKSLISQREIGSDALSFPSALRAALREDPNVILVGEMRDPVSVEAALTLAETGHLVFTTLHTNNAAQTADRIIDVFPEHQQQQIRSQLANVISGIVSQRLLPKVGGGRLLACEILIADSAVRSLIRESKTHQLNNVIQTSAASGMISLDKVLADLVSRGEVTLDNALAWAMEPREFKAMVY